MNIRSSLHIHEFDISSLTQKILCFQFSLKFPGLNLREPRLSSQRLTYALYAAVCVSLPLAVYWHLVKFSVLYCIFCPPMSPERKITDISDVNGSVEAVKRWKKLTLGLYLSETVTLFTYFAIRDCLRNVYWPYSHLSQQHIPRVQRGMSYPTLEISWHFQSQCVS
jgi:hypothetical protein